MAWQLLCVDGADAKRVFLLPNPGTYLVGTSHKHCDICLHDLYVARVHCQIDISDDGLIIVSDQHPATGTFVNRERIEQKPVGFGDIIRVGNSHLRLEPAAAPEEAAETVAEILEEEVLQGEIIDDKSGPPPLVEPALLCELEGYTLGHFKLDELIESNRLKAIFRGIDEKSGQVVCIKVLSPDFPATQAELNHFASVMNRALHLRHPHLVTMFSAGRSGHYVWIAREYVEGKCLVQVLEKLARKVKPKWHAGLRLLQELGSALHFIHNQRLVHGNLTPHNVLIRDEGKQAKLANLMFYDAVAGSQLLAQAQDPKLAQDAPYMSPEQCHDLSASSHLSDLYGLGAVAYARVTGRPPFVGDTAESTMKAVRTKALTPPSKWNADIPAEFEEILMQLLAKQRHDRFQSAVELLSALEVFAEEGAVD